MEFPAARTPEWLQAAFDGPQQPQQQQRQPAAADLDTTPRLLLATPSGTTATPAARRRNSSSSNSSNSSNSGRSIYEERAAAVRSSIREALFRQALFQIQNVEVQTVSKCGAPRILAAAAVRFDRKQQQQQQLEPAAADTKGSGLLSSLKARAKKLLAPNSNSSNCSSSSHLGELLRAEDWSVDRCGSTRVYEVCVHRDEADFFSLSLKPQRLTDRLRLWWFKFADANDD
ncbi:hypothetical protein Esti_005420 [Eimeria stiedai]